MDDMLQKVRERAYQIWIDEGRPSGREQEHWDQACRDCGVSETPQSERIDDSLEQSFPSSDPVSEAQPGGGITGPGS